MADDVIPLLSMDAVVPEAGIIGSALPEVGLAREVFKVSTVSAEDGKPNSLHNLRTVLTLPENAEKFEKKQISLVYRFVVDKTKLEPQFHNPGEGLENLQRDIDGSLSSSAEVQVLFCSRGLNVRCSKEDNDDLLDVCGAVTFSGFFKGGRGRTGVRRIQERTSGKKYYPFWPAAVYSYKEPGRSYHASVLFVIAFYTTTSGCLLQNTTYEDFADRILEFVELQQLSETVCYRPGPFVLDFF